MIKSETGASSASPDAAASPAQLTSNAVYVLQKECIPTVKRTKHETEAVLSASLGIAASPSAIPSVFTGTRKLLKPIIKYENTESSSAHPEVELDHGPLAVVSPPQSVLPAAAAALQEAGVEAAHGRLGVAQRAERAPPPDPRAWSAAVAETCSIYTVRAFLGDPDASLPSWIKALNKSQLQGMMQSSGFGDISGTKDALLYRFQTGVPFVEYRIDGRECLQRMLVVCLHAWRWDDSHMFRATMPARVDCPAPFRTVTGVGFDDEGGALSLEECELAAGDRISMLYDLAIRARSCSRLLGLKETKRCCPRYPSFTT